MSKTSIKNYVIASLVGSLVITIFILAYVMADNNYNIEGIDSSALYDYGNFTEISEDINSSTSAVSDLNADRSLFDVIGGLIVESISAIKSFISGISFMKSAVSNMLGSGIVYIPKAIIVTVIGIISVSLAGVLLFKYIGGKDDEI